MGTSGSNLREVPRKHSNAPGARQLSVSGHFRLESENVSGHTDTGDILLRCAILTGWFRLRRLL